MRQAILLTIALAVALCSCACAPDSYPPPPQYEPPHGQDPPVLELGFPNPHAKILGGVLDQPGVKGFQWTDAHPRFSFELNRTGGLDFYMHFGVHDKTFAGTGPVTLTIRINGEVIDRPRFETPGVRDYRHPVDARLLQLRNPVEVAIDVDPAWVVEDKTVLGTVLFSIGFTEHGT